MSTTSSVPADTSWKADDKWLLGVVIAVITFWLFAQTLLNVIPGIQSELGIELTTANLAVSITSLFSGLFIVIAGGLADRIGRVKILRIGIILSILGSLLIAPAPENMGAFTSFMLLAERVVQGLSAAAIMPSSMALLKDFYEGKDRQRAISHWSIGSWGGSGLTALFGGFMATSPLGWRSIFWISAVLGVVSLFLIRGTPERKAARNTDGPAYRFDWGGVIAFVISLLALNVYISQGPNIGWLSLSGIGLIAVTAIAGLIFLQIETHHKTPFLDLNVFRNGTFTGATLSNFMLNGAAGTLIVALDSSRWPQGCHRYNPAYSPSGIWWLSLVPSAWAKNCSRNLVRDVPCSGARPSPVSESCCVPRRSCSLSSTSSPRSSALPSSVSVWASTPLRPPMRH